MPNSKPQPGPSECDPLGGKIFKEVIKLKRMSSGP